MKFFGMLILLLVCIGCAPSDIKASNLPENAWKYKRDMSRSAWVVFGPGAPIPLLGAQIHQESAWKIDARSWAGAEGFAQFMPGTAKDMAERYPEHCAPANPLNPEWAFRCRDRYLKEQKDRVTNSRTDDCSSWALSLKAYNGGRTWVNRDRAFAEENGADPDDWKVVNQFNSGRKESAYLENKEYPEKIFRLEEKKYRSWGSVLKCL